MGKIYTTNEFSASRFTLFVEEENTKSYDDRYIKRIEYFCDKKSVREFFIDLGIFSREDVKQKRKRQYRIMICNNEIFFDTDEIYEWWYSQEEDYYLCPENGISQFIENKYGSISSCGFGLAIEIFTEKDYYGMN